MSEKWVNTLGLSGAVSTVFMTAPKRPPRAVYGGASGPSASRQAAWKRRLALLVSTLVPAREMKSC